MMREDLQKKKYIEKKLWQHAAHIAKYANVSQMQFAYTDMLTLRAI